MSAQDQLRRTDIDDDATRRRFLQLIGAGGLLAGCADDRDSVGAAVPSATPTTGYPRTVRHEVGETRIESPPGRILALTDGAELGAMLALGMAPAAFGQRNDPLLPWVSAAGGDSPTIERFPLTGDVNYEVIAGLRPDLIIGQFGFVTPETIGTFQAIAPTVSTSFINWRTSLRQVADALGVPERAEQVSTDIDARVAAAAARLNLAGLRVAIFSVFDGNEIYALNDKSPAGELLAALGAEPLYPQRTSDEAADLIAAELVGTELECDVAFVQLYDDDRAAYDKAREAGIFNALRAYQSGRVIELNGDDSQAIYFSSVLTIPWSLDVFERELALVPPGAGTSTSPPTPTPTPTANAAPNPTATPTP